MKLGALEIKHEDLLCEIAWPSKAALDRVVYVVNELLQERLEQDGIVLFGHATEKDGKVDAVAFSWNVGVAREDTYMGRLVCIESFKPKKEEE